MAKAEEQCGEEAALPHRSIGRKLSSRLQNVVLWDLEKFPRKTPDNSPVLVGAGSRKCDRDFACSKLRRIHPEIALI
jgi:hypothetical protein